MSNRAGAVVEPEPNEPWLPIVSEEPVTDEPAAPYRKVSLTAIVIDPDLQPRERIDKATVEHYADLLRDGVALPPVQLVSDGERFWLADGFHRVHAHKNIGRFEVDAEIHEGSLKDAVRIALRANAKHGMPRTKNDCRRAYHNAQTYGLLADPADVAEVQRLLACSQAWAYALTENAREAKASELRRRVLEMAEQAGDDPNGAEIARTLQEAGSDINGRTVQRWIKDHRETAKPTDEATKFQPGNLSPPDEAPAPENESAEVQPALLREDQQTEPEQLDIEDAIEEAEMDSAAADPLAAYEAQRAAEAPQRAMWGGALAALEEIGKMPSPEELFANRYVKFDYLFGPALENAAARIARLMELWTGEGAARSVINGQEHHQ